MLMRKLLHIKASLLTFMIVTPMCVLLPYASTSRGEVVHQTEYQYEMTIFDSPLPVVYVETGVVHNPTPEEIAEEIRDGELEIVAQLVQAEAGNQDYLGKRLVAGVVFNRIDSPIFPNSAEEVIFQKNPTQFQVTVNGAFDRAGWEIADDTFQAVRDEYFNRTDPNILYFGRTKKNGKNCFKHGDHFFGY